MQRQPHSWTCGESWANNRFGPEDSVTTISLFCNNQWSRCDVHFTVSNRASLLLLDPTPPSSCSCPPAHLVGMQLRHARAKKFCAGGLRSICQLLLGFSMFLCLTTPMTRTNEQLHSAQPLARNLYESTNARLEIQRNGRRESHSNLDNGYCFVPLMTSALDFATRLSN
jgi:hypothetical protein